MLFLKGEDLINFLDSLKKKDTQEAREKRVLAKMFLEIAQSEHSYEERIEHIKKCLITTNKINQNSKKTINLININKYKIIIDLI